MRPPGPEPATLARSTPATCALRRVAGEAITRVDAAGPAGATAAGAACGFAAGGVAARCRCRLRRARGLRGRGARGVECDEFGADRDHVARLPGEGNDAPADGRRNLDRRLVGHDLGDDLVFRDRVADLDLPLDDFGRDRAFAEVRHLENVAAHAGLHDGLEGFGDARLAGKVFPFEGVRIRRVPARDAQDRRSQVPEAVFLHGRESSAPKPAKRVASCDDDAASGPRNRVADRVGVERHHRSHVDDLRVEAERRGPRPRCTCTMVP